LVKEEGVKIISKNRKRLFIYIRDQDVAEYKKWIRVGILNYRLDEAKIFADIAYILNIAHTVLEYR
jgi:hypothetical protein